MEAVKPPMLTMPEPVPCRSGGLAGRAKSKPIIDAGPQAPSTAHSTISSHSGARPGQASAAPHTSAVTPTVPRARGSRARCWRAMSCP